MPDKRTRTQFQKLVAQVTARSKSPDEREMLALTHGNLAAYGAGEGSFGNATAALTYLASQAGAVGCAQVMAGEDRGFAEIDRARMYNEHMIRALVRAYERDERPGKQPRVTMETLATCWLHTISIGLVLEAQRLTRLVAQLNDGSGAVGGMQMSPLCALVAHLALGESFSVLEKKGWAAAGVYQVAERPLGTEEFELLADYHLKRVSGAGYPEFQSYPYCLLPVEIRALERLGRGTLGPTDHPLLSSPLASPRDAVALELDDELKRFRDRAGKELEMDWA